MPEAAIDKHGYALLSKDKVGLAWQWRVPPPSVDAVGSENRNQSQLSIFVSARTNRGHNCGTLGNRKYIDHFLIHRRSHT
jgi:hypothetical protein